MPMAVKQDPDLVQFVSVEIGEEKCSCRFAHPLPHAEAMRRLWIILSTFDREETPNNQSRYPGENHDR